MAVRITRPNTSGSAFPTITAAGTFTIPFGVSIVRMVPSAVGAVTLNLDAAFTGPTQFVNRKTDATAVLRTVRIVPPSGKTIEDDPWLDLDFGDTQVTLTGTNYTATTGGILSPASASLRAPIPAITVAGTYPINATASLVKVSATAVGAVILNLASDFIGPTQFINRKTDATASLRTVRIVPPAGKTIEGDPWLDLDFGETELNLLGTDYVSSN